MFFSASVFSVGVPLGSYPEYCCKENPDAGHHQDGYTESLPECKQADEGNFNGASGGHSQAAGYGMHELFLLLLLPHYSNEGQEACFPCGSEKLSLGLESFWI